MQTITPREPAALGRTVDEVLRGFIRESDEWCGIYVVEATLIVTNAGPAQIFRVQGAGLTPGRIRIGVSMSDGLLIRDATSAEQDKLEDGVTLGFVQIERFRSRGGYGCEVLHQATGQSIARVAETAAVRGARAASVG